MDNDVSKIYNTAAARWGIPAQVDKTIEECAELIKVLCKWKLCKEGSSEAGLWFPPIREEMADVTIMLAQLKLAFGDISTEIAAKLRRLKARLQVPDREETHEGKRDVTRHDPVFEPYLALTLGKSDRNGCDLCPSGPDNDHYCTPILINGIPIANVCEKHLDEIKRGARDQ